MCRFPAVAPISSASVPRLVLVASGGVSKPKSAVYLFLNTVAGGIMDAKISGEDSLRRLYAGAAVSSKGLGYTVVRPGGLKADPPTGALFVSGENTLNSGEISRDLVADVCVASLTDAKASNKVIEIIEK